MHNSVILLILHLKIKIFVLEYNVYELFVFDFAYVMDNSKLLLDLALSIEINGFMGAQRL